jgi:hypothetical protein
LVGEELTYCEANAVIASSDEDDPFISGGHGGVKQSYSFEEMIGLCYSARFVRRLLMVVGVLYAFN